MGEFYWFRKTQWPPDFCGASGPESVVEINFKSVPPFKTDQVVTITGVLELNKYDVDHFNYILNKAEGQLTEQ